MAIPIQQFTKVENKLDEIISYLSWCESRNRSDIKVLDVNGYYSHGRFQFQWFTWNYYLDKYDLFPESVGDERWNLIYDGEIQEIVVRKILEEKGGKRNWFNCLLKYSEELP